MALALLAGVCERDTFDEQRFYPLSEERSMELDAVAHLPDRVGHLWLKTRSEHALKIRTADIDLPQDLEKQIRPILNDPGLGARLSRREFDRQVSERDQQFSDAPDSDVGERLETAYRQVRGGAS